ncbi:craniofacial development protein 1 isoform X1 [Neodiprion virginianus]|uniref:craniofacial development protein 1 isoform X1 n=2 Tax=Neodiprion virginianus TaxID=2961670 RepID=UPI001EE6EE32|nr:craniofacial development protein 1 isoform X1 [Neodiprion virginianus]
MTSHCHIIRIELSSHLVSDQKESMSNEHELPSDSDDDDEDYIPDGADNEAGSEVESEGEIESGPEDENDENLKVSDKHKGKGKGTKRGLKNQNKSTKRLRNVGEGKQESNDSQEQTEENEAKKKLSEEDEKKRADSLWADFMKDTSVVSRPKSKNSINSSKEELTQPLIKSVNEEKVKITKVFEFAGEEVRVEKEVPADCAEARLVLSSTRDSTADSMQRSSGGAKGRGICKGGLSGISSVLCQLGKKAKISTLEKSKLDWDSYKKEENIEEEISTHNKGKDGYLERQDFLQRADIRQFEIEKQMRTTRRSAR